MFQANYTYNYYDFDSKAYSYVLKHKPLTQAISLSQVKAHLKLDESDTSQDLYLKSIISAVVDYAEKFTKRDFIIKKYLTYRDCFYDGITLRKCKVQEIESIKYYSNQILTTLDSSNYYITDEPDYFSQIFTTASGSFPSVDSRQQAIQILFFAGLGIKISTISRTSNTTTITTAENHNLNTGQSVIISGVSDNTFNGSFIITRTGDKTFTYANQGSNGSGSADAGSFMAVNIIPDDLIFAMLNHIARIYENRGDCTLTNSSGDSVVSISNLPPESVQIYNIYKILEVGI